MHFEYILWKVLCFKVFQNSIPFQIVLFAILHIVKLRGVVPFIRCAQYEIIFQILYFVFDIHF